MSDDQSGKRFSQLYLGGGETLPDSPRARVRVASVLGEYSHYLGGLAELIERELGVRVPSVHGYNLRGLIEQCALRDFLDSISIIHQHLDAKAKNLGRSWIASCRRVFAEEKLRYTINDSGGVRFAADAAFEGQVQTTLANLGNPNLAGALACFDEALQSLSQTPPDGKTAIRGIFESVEIAFKTLCPGPTRIGDGEITKFLLPKLNEIYQADDVARQVANKMARSLGEWVNAGHFYRHGQLGDKPVQPPLDIAIAIVSEGTAFLRWLAGMLPK